MYIPCFSYYFFLRVLISRLVAQFIENMQFIMLLMLNIEIKKSVECLYDQTSRMSLSPRLEKFHIVHRISRWERRTQVKGGERDELESLENATMRGDECCNREYEVPLTPVASASPGHGFREKVRLVEPYVIYMGLPLHSPSASPDPSRILRGVSRSPQSWYTL